MTLWEVSFSHRFGSLNCTRVNKASYDKLTSKQESIVLILSLMLTMNVIWLTIWVPSLTSIKWWSINWNSTSIRSFLLCCFLLGYYTTITKMKPRHHLMGYMSEAAQHFVPRYVTLMWRNSVGQICPHYAAPATPRGPIHLWGAERAGGKGSGFCDTGCRTQSILSSIWAPVHSSRKGG